MLSKHLFAATAFCLVCLSCASQSGGSTKNTLAAEALQPFGRAVLNENHQLELIGSAVHFGYSFEGKESSVYYSLQYLNGHSYLQYELDGKYQKRVRIEGNTTAPLIITAAKAGRHTMWIYKTTEATSGAILIDKVAGNHIKSLTPPAGPLIEFIGNSITCGAAADASEIRCDSGEYHDHHNAYYAYGPRVARALKVNFIMSSVSGIGIYRNWNSDGPTMPQVYEKASLQEEGPQWDFKQYTPNVVSIALGTNDFSNGDGKTKRLPFDSASFVNSYIKFLQLVKSKYPKAQIALLSSAMVGGNNRLLLQNCLTAVKEKTDKSYPADKPVALFFFEPMQPRGCGGHPSVEDHAILAQELIPFFKKLL